MSNFIIQALRGLPLTVHGDGAQTRSFCYVDDQVRGLLALLDRDVRVPVNIGNPYEVTVAELADLVLEVTGSGSPITHGDPPPDDPGRRCPDIGRARRCLGWEPEVGLRDGVERTVAWFASRL